MRRRILKAMLGSAALTALGLTPVEPARAQDSDESPDWAAFTLEELRAGWQKKGGPYLQFLDVPSMVGGLYSLAAGAEDRQQPHKSDEIYHVISGKAKLEVAGEKQKVGPGSLVYVKAGVDHRFVEIEEDLQVLVVFARG